MIPDPLRALPLAVRGVAVWLAAPYGVREFEIGPLQGGSDWSNTLYRAGQLVRVGGINGRRL